MPLSHLRLSSFPVHEKNNIQAKILASSHLTNVLLIYLAAFFTIKLIDFK